MIWTQLAFNMENLCLVYVKEVCVNANKTYEYDCYFSETPEIVWGPDWDINTPNSCGDITPDPTTYSVIKRIVSPFKLKTIEDTSCYSMEYAIFKIIALSWIDLDNVEDYPENGRMVLHFGDKIDDVKGWLSKYDIEL